MFSDVCSVGEFRNETGGCEFCPVDTYQDQENQDSCVECGEGRGTNRTGATNSTECTGQ